MKCLIIDDVHQSMFPLMEKAGLIPDYHPHISRAELLTRLSAYDGLVVRSKTRIDKEVFDSAPELQFIGRVGAGMDNIEVKVAEERGVPLFNAPEGNRDAVAEHALGMLLSLMNYLPSGDAQVREFLWDREGHRGHELGACTVGVLGFGFMGEAFSKRLKGFGCRVLAYDKYKRDFGGDGVEECSLETLQKESNVLSIHVPLTTETEGMVDEHFLAKFPRPLWLLNTARGPVLKLKALNEALDTGRILGAGLDVLPKEKFSKLTAEERQELETLFSNPKVILSPHVGGWTMESHVKLNEVLIRKITSHFNL